MEPERSSRRLPRLRGVLPPLVALCLYLPSLRNDFAFDDVHAIQENPLVCGPHADIANLISNPYWGTVKPTDRSAYRPLTTLLHAGLCRAFGATPSVHRLLNVLFHAISSLLLFVLLSRLTTNPRVSSFFALLFAVHPLHSEPVLFAAFRPELVVTTCALSIVIIARVVFESGVTALRVVALVLLQIAAVFSKENAVMVPILALLSLLTLPRPWPFRRAASVFVLLSAVNALYLLARHAVLGSFLSATSFSFLDNPVAQAETAIRVMTAISVFARYLGLFFLPVGQSNDYSFAEIEPVSSPSDPLFLAGCLAIAIALSLMAAPRLRNAVSTFGLAWLFVAMVPVSNALFPIGTVMAERLCYLPFVGLFIALSVLGGRCPAMAARVVAPVSVATLIVFASLAVQRGLGIEDNCAFFRRLVTEAPRSAKAHYGHAICRLEQDDVTTAIRSLDLALRRYPDYEDAAIQLAQALERAGQVEEGLARLSQFATTHPHAKSAAFAWAKMLARNRRFDEAKAVFDDLRARYPDEALFRVYRERLPVRPP